MGTETEHHGEAPRRINRRQMIAGSGIAAAAWAAPSIVRLDVASAAGSASTTTTIAPGVTPGNVTVSNPTSTESMGSGENSYGAYGREGPAGSPPDLGPVFSVSDPNALPNSQVTVTVRICFNDKWEASGSGADELDIRVNGVSGVDATTGQPFPNFDVPTDPNVCRTYVLEPVMHMSGPLLVDVEATVKAKPEDFGISLMTLEYC